MIAETGADMSRFTTPGTGLLAGGPRSTTSPADAWARAAASRNRYIGAYTRDLRRRRQGRHPRGRPPPPPARKRGKAKPSSASAPQMRAYHALLPDPGLRSRGLGPAYYDPNRQAARPVSRRVGTLDALGYDATLCRPPEPDGPGPRHLTPARAHPSAQRRSAGATCQAEFIFRVSSD